MGAVAVRNLQPQLEAWLYCSIHLSEAVGAVVGILCLHAAAWLPFAISAIFCVILFSASLFVPPHYADYNFDNNSDKGGNAK